MDMSERSISVHKIAQTESVKFDYFVCSVVAAIFAYLVKDYSPHKIGFDFNTVETLSLVCLVISFFAGFKRIELHNEFMRVNHSLLDAIEQAEVLTDDLNQTPPKFPPDVLKRKYDLRQELLLGQNVYRAMLNKISPKAGFCYKMRNLFLYVGFASIVLSKVLQPYETSVSSSANISLPQTNALMPSKYPTANQTKTTPQSTQTPKQ
jgi:hypothetical protein